MTALVVVIGLAVILIGAVTVDRLHPEVRAQRARDKARRRERREFDAETIRRLQSHARVVNRLRLAGHRELADEFEAKGPQQ